VAGRGSEEDQDPQRQERASAATSPELRRADRRLFAVATGLTAAAAVLHFATSVDLAQFAVSAVALAALAAVVARGVDQLGQRLRPGPTGVLQGVFGNLPELMFSIFALRAGLLTVVQAALVGSVLGNVLLVQGLAFVAGGLRHGTQRFGAEQARALVLMLVLAVAVVMVPTVVAGLGGPVAHHRRALSSVVAVVLLVVYGLNLVTSLRAPGKRGRAAGQGQRAELSTGALRTLPADEPRRPTGAGGWSISMTLVVLGTAAVAAAFVADWFVDALSPAIHTLGVSEAFSGLVIVAIASNAVENVAGVQLAARDRSDHALSVILQSPLQILLVLMPVLVLLSPAIGGPALSFDLPPALVVSLALATVVTVVVVFDGESTWTEGVALLGLYAVVAASFWWG
jgi:Ca2+:H+ antiporter